MELAIRDQKLVPAGWLCDKHGCPSTDRRDVFGVESILPCAVSRDGSLQRLRLAVMVTWSGVLSGTGYGAMLTLQTQGVFLGAWQVEAFLPFDDFVGMLDKALSALRETPPADGHERVLTPGEREWSAQEERNRLGIPLHPTVVEELREVGTELGIRFPSAVPVAV